MENSKPDKMEITQPIAAMNCDHPSGHVHYYSEIADDGSQYEDMWCDVCNLWLTPHEQHEFTQRSDMEWAD